MTFTTVTIFLKTGKQIQYEIDKRPKQAFQALSIYLQDSDKDVFEIFTLEADVGFVFYKDQIAGFTCQGKRT